MSGFWESPFYWEAEERYYSQFRTDPRLPRARPLSERGATESGHDGAPMPAHPYPDTSQASGPDPAILPPRSESDPSAAVEPTVHELAQAIVNGGAFTDIDAVRVARAFLDAIVAGPFMGGRR